MIDLSDLPFTPDQLKVLGIMLGVLLLLVWGRWRYDLVAFAALVVAVIIGVVDKDSAFDGFGHPATIIIALVLVVSHGLSSSGAVDIIARHLTSPGRSIPVHISIMSSVGGLLSGIMNNVGALALLMPVDINTARKAKRSPAWTLMPLSFATILGGLVTLIGTPPNIIISTYREQALGEPFRMFDFTPVGIVCAAAGIAFIALIGWRLIPRSAGDADNADEAFTLNDYIAELTVTEESDFAGTQLVEVEEISAKSEVKVLNVIQDRGYINKRHGWTKLQPGDVLLIETAAENLDDFVAEHKLAFVDSEHQSEKLRGADLDLVEVVVRPGSRIEGRSSNSMSLFDNHGIWLVGIQREGRRIQKRVRREGIAVGDVLLLLGPSERTRNFVDDMGLVPLAERGLEVKNTSKALLAAALFGGAIAASSFGLLYLPVALALVCVLYALFSIVPLKQIYETIEWPVVVLIGSLIPIGAALEKSGASKVLAQGIVDISEGLPAWAILTILMALTMTLSDVLNNTATALVAAPISVEVANSLGVNPDPFLMAVAVAASCAFLTPIGHKNNTLIMGPGGYRFGDYWRMGLPLEIIVVAVGVPMILLVWPL
ncbi:MAG: SLC13 family permease [Filomicrobium sp.]